VDLAVLILTLVLALGIGIALVALLSCKVSNIPIFMVLIIVLLVADTYLVFIYLQPGERIIATSLCLMFGLIGYAIGTWQLLYMDRPREMPRLQDRPVSNPGYMAVVYFSHGESEEYDQQAWVHQFREFDHQGLKFMPRLARPFFFTILRSKYMKGRSRHCSIHARMMQNLAEEYRKEGKGELKFYLSFLDEEPRPDVAAAKAYNEGASTIVVAKVFLTDSNHTAEGDGLVKGLRLEDRGVRMIYTEPLWDSALLRRSFLEKANQVIAPAAKATTGVLLVGHGQPEEWDREFATETEHENLFREGVLRDFVQDGYKGENVRLAWMAFKEPNTTQVVEEMAASGVKRIIFFSAAISADGIHSQSDIPELVEKAKVSKGIEIVDLGAWNDHPLVIAAIKEKVDKAMRQAS